MNIEKVNLKLNKNTLPGLSIEPTNICNANCIFCAYQYQERPIGVMDFNLYCDLIDQFCEAGGGPVGLTPTVGDPLVHPRLPEMIAYASAKPEIKSIGMYSNMISLRRFGAAALIDAGLTELIVSCSGLSDEMYRRIYRSTRYSVVVKAIEEFATVNNQRGRPVHVQLDLRVDLPVSQVRAFPDHQRLAALVGPENILIKRRYDSWGGKIQQKDLTGLMRLRGNDLASRAYDLLVRPRISPCSELYSGLIVYWDGKVGACGCRDVDASELCVGDAKTQRLVDIWTGEVLAALRRDFMTSSPTLCQKCSHYNNLSSFLRDGTVHTDD